MRAGKRLGILLLIPGVLLILCARGAQETQAREVVRVRVDAPTAAATFVGVPSCSARSCHGADSPAANGRLLRNEYTTWIESDPHAVAYSVLLGDRAARIMKNLSPPPGKQIAAHEDTRCLACHCEPHVAAQADLVAQRLGGVGCEACHGPAGRWVGPHTATALWGKRTAAEKQQLGMMNVKDAADLARACVGCHVGAPADANAGIPLRDVNHDLLAAGHPRLDFEFATFLANVPAHWKQAEGSPDSERRAGARPWAIGQIASARASLTLLADRATRAGAENQTGTWPEFAEYDCSSCHHALTTPSARQRRAEHSGNPGASTWGNWYLSMPERLLAEGSGKVQAFAELRNHLERPSPALTSAAKLVNAALTELTRIEKRTNELPEQKLAALSLERLRQFSPPADRSSWELAEQLSLSAAFLERARSSPGKSEKLLAQCRIGSGPQPAKRFSESSHSLTAWRGRGASIGTRHSNAICEHSSMVQPNLDDGVLDSLDADYWDSRTSSMPAPSHSMRSCSKSKQGHGKYGD